MLEVCMNAGHAMGMVEETGMPLVLEDEPLDVGLCRLLRSDDLTKEPVTPALQHFFERVLSDIGMSQNKLADRMGVSNATTSRFFKEKMHQGRSAERIMQFLLRFQHAPSTKVDNYMSYLKGADPVVGAVFQSKFDHFVAEMAQFIEKRKKELEEISNR